MYIWFNHILQYGIVGLIGIEYISGHESQGMDWMCTVQDSQALDVVVWFGRGACNDVEIRIYTHLYYSYIEKYMQYFWLHTHIWYIVSFRSVSFKPVMFLQLLDMLVPMLHPTWLQSHRVCTDPCGFVIQSLCSWFTLMCYAQFTSILQWAGNQYIISCYFRDFGNCVRVPFYLTTNSYWHALCLSISRTSILCFELTGSIHLACASFALE